jgi:signal transduction histidine kinase
VTTPANERRTLGLTSLLQRSIIFAVALAMLMFALPLAVAVSGLYRSQALEDLARDAERSRGALTTEVLADPGRIGPALAGVALHDPGVEVGVYDASGALVAGRGPAEGDKPVRSAAGPGGVEQVGIFDGLQITVVPLTGDGDAEARYVVRAAEPYATVQHRVYLTWALMAALAAVVLAVVSGLARSRARRIARPLQHLAEAAASLGQGDFSVRAARGGVAEVDAASENLERTARRLGGILERERAFSADASHQLRTPLTAVRIGLESALITPGADLHAAAEDALVELDRLEQTVLDLLALARDTRTSAEATDVAVLCGRSAQLWAKRFAERDRRLQLRLEPDLLPAAVSQPALRTVLDVLLDNALTHGDGTVRLSARDQSGTVVLEVGDEGQGLDGDPKQVFARRSPEARGTGIGLALARSLVEADGGRLEVTSTRPAVFAVLLPAWRTGELTDPPPAEPVARAEPADPYVVAGTRPGGS